MVPAPDISRILTPIAPRLAEVEGRLRAAMASRVPETEPLRAHVNRHEGKRLRPALLLLAAEACGTACPRHVEMAAIVELIHMASLIHDDVIDQADLRRGLPSVPCKWGNEVAVIFGDMAFASAFALLASLDAPWATRLLAHTTCAMCEGEMRQLLRRFDATVTKAEYLRSIEGKTSELFDASARLGAHDQDGRAPREGALGAYARNLGVAFQIVDDCLDLTGEEATVGKTLYTDLGNGRLTLPLIHVLEQTPAAEREGVRRLLFPPDGPIGRDAIAAAMHRHDAMGYSHETARGYAGRAKAALEPLPDSPGKRSLLLLADYVVERRR